MKLKYLQYVLIVFIVAFAIMAFLLLKSSGITEVNKLQEFVLGFGMLAPFVFILIYILGTLFGISAVIFTVLAGTIFGLWLGWLLVVVAANITANSAFLISRYFHKYFKRSNKKKTNGIIDSLVKKMEDSAKENGFVTILLLRMSFLPYVPLSYAAGLVKSLKMRDFILATFLTNLIGSFFLIFLGFSITQSLPHFIMAIVLVITLSQAPRIIKRIR